MKSRFFGAASYDDEEEEELDLSGFVTSSETQPIVVERPRNKPNNTETEATPPSNMGNAGPKYVPPPMGAAHTPNMVTNAAVNEGSPWNPLWTDDNAWGPNILYVVLKTGGIAALCAGAVYSAGSKSLRGFGGKAMIVGTAAYVHPSLGFNYGQLDRWTGEMVGWKQYPIKILSHLAGGAAFRYALKRV